MKLTLMVTLILVAANIPATQGTFKKLKKYYEDIEPFFDFFTKKPKHHKKPHHHHLHGKFVHHKEIIKEVPIFVPIGHLYQHGGHRGFYDTHSRYGGHFVGFPPENPHGGLSQSHGGLYGGHGGLYGGHAGFVGGHEGLYGGYGGYGGFDGGHGDIHDIF